jgi:capsid protein
MSNWGGKRPNSGRKVISNSAFEGAREDYGRTFIYMPEYTEQEMEPYDLCRLRGKSRWLINQYGLPARAIDGVAQYTVGKGICPQARTANRLWNQQAEDAFESKCGTAGFGFDVAGQVNFYEAQDLIVKQVLTDGDFFAQLMLSGSGSGMCRFVSGEYCKTKIYNGEFYDGVKVNKFGKPIEYQFITDVEKQVYQVIPAEDIIHFKRLYRQGYVRGVPALRHAVNHLHDMTDILAFTKGSFKLSSQIAFILESGEAGKVGLGANVVKVTQGNGTVTHDKMYPLAGHVQLKAGERLTPLKNEHPGESFDPFMAYLTRDICWGIGVSPEILWAIAGIGGANTRYVLADAQVFFSKLQQWLINVFCRRFYVYWLWHEIQAGRLSYPGNDWWRHQWLCPERVTVDFTKDGKLLADLVDRGLLSPERYYGMQGLDAETEELDVIRRRARRKVMVEEIAAEEGVELTVTECFPPPPGSTQVMPPPEEQEVDKRPEE